MSACRITLLTTGLAIGGAETQVVLLAKSLKKRGWNLQIVSMLPPVAFESELMEADIPVLNLAMRRGVPDPRAVFKTARHLRTFRPHIVHCHMIHANLLGRVSRLLASVPVLVSTAHNIWEGDGWRDWAYRLTDPLSDLTSNVSRAGFDRYVKDRLIPEGKGVFVPNGLDFSVFAPSAQVRETARSACGWKDCFVWLAVGNLRDAKDYPNLLGAFSRVLSEQPQALLAIAGTGPLATELESEAHRAGIHERVQFLGRRTDIRQLMQAADGYVISSEWEGTPIALLEASGSGLPVVATRVGGNPEVVEHQRTGLLVPPKDSAALARAMVQMMRTPAADRTAMGLAGRSRSESLFGHQRVLDIWENIYEQLLQTSSRRSGMIPRWRFGAFGGW